MVYIYVCKRFRVSMDIIQGRDGDWVNNLLNTYCKHARIHAILERAEINPKKRLWYNSYLNRHVMYSSCSHSLPNHF